MVSPMNQTSRSTSALANMATTQCSLKHVKRVAQMKRIAEAFVVDANLNVEEEDYETAYILYTQALFVLEEIVPQLADYEACFRVPEISSYFRRVCPKIRKKQLRTGRLLDDIAQRSATGDQIHLGRPLTSTTFYFTDEDRLQYEVEIRQRKADESRIMRERQPIQDLPPPPPPVASSPLSSFDSELQRKRDFGRYLKESDELRIQMEAAEYIQRNDGERQMRRQSEEDEQRRLNEEKQRKRNSVLRRARLIEAAERNSKSSDSSSQFGQRRRVHFEDIMEVDEDQVVVPEPSNEPPPNRPRQAYHSGRTSDDFGSHYSLSLTDTTISTPSSTAGPLISPSSDTSASGNPFTFWSPYRAPISTTPHDQNNAQAHDRQLQPTQQPKVIEKQERDAIENDPFPGGFLTPNDRKPLVSPLHSQNGENYQNSTLNGASNNRSEGISTELERANEFERFIPKIRVEAAPMDSSSIPFFVNGARMRS